MPRRSLPFLKREVRFFLGNTILIFGLLLMFTAGSLWLCLAKLSQLPPPKRADIAQQKIAAGNYDQLTRADWKALLTPEQFVVLREGGTEIAFSGTLVHENRPGTYVTADCGIPVFRSEQKFDSGTGWPSFWAPIDTDILKLVEDERLGITRTELIEPTCNSHLGHVFDDGPPPSGKRYCINSAALKFIPD